MEGNRAVRPDDYSLDDTGINRIDLEHISCALDHYRLASYWPACSFPSVVSIHLHQLQVKLKESKAVITKHRIMELVLLVPLNRGYTESFFSDTNQLLFATAKMTTTRITNPIPTTTNGSTEPSVLVGVGF